ncbi:MAG: rubrerythrin family protein [Spirochaetales bacterium]|jgi:rubrerythrin|nr:rubrerythrin family protein [Exilispira sp.]NMC67423.1 rubrerythrin family protein [Spirochaetales bacterium]
MKSVKGTETEKNLLKSFAGESQARMRYDYFASVARKEGYEMVAAIFDETAKNEREHAKRFFSFLEGGAVEITASYPAGKIGTTLENLKAAAMGEHEEYTELYPNFADIAEKEGFQEIAVLYRGIANVEKHHEQRYLKLADLIEKKKMFAREVPKLWKCRNCGHIHQGEEAPVKCPVCAHPQSYFEILCEDF